MRNARKGAKSEWMWMVKNFEGVAADEIWEVEGSQALPESRLGGKRAKVLGSLSDMGLREER